MTITEKIKDKKTVHIISIFFMLCYFISYVTRINYGAIIAEMESARHISKSLLSLALSGSAVTYAAGQIISGYLGDKFQPKRLIFIGLLTTVATNIAVPFAGSITLTIAIWCINGFAQAFMWPPLVKMMTSMFTMEDYTKACIIVSCGSAAGTIAVYLLSPIIISVSGWKDVFWVSAAAAAVFSAFWLKFCPNVKISPQQKKSRESGPGEKFITPLMILIMIAIILQGSLRDGVTTWMPSLISETYNMSSTIAILSGVVLPIFSMFSYTLAEQLYKKIFKNIMVCSGTIYAVSAAAGVLLLASSGKSAVLSIIGCMLITGCMHGVNLLLISFTPPFFAKSGKAAFASGLLNSCTYIGSSISVYGFAKITENTSWNTTLWLWLAISVLGVILCLASSGRWKRDMMN